MKNFLEKHQDKIQGVLSCFDRVVFKGYLPLGWAGAMELLLAKNNFLIKDFKKFVERYSQQIKDAAQALAKEWQRVYRPVHNNVDKEELARTIAAEQKITEGLVCILTAVETSPSFRVVPGVRRPKIINAQRPCLCLYFYFIDPLFGLLHVRLPTWFPFPVQIGLNGHAFLARRLTQEGIGFVQPDNAFVQIDDFPRAQALANDFIQQPWPEILSAYARRVNPLLGHLLAGMHYYWVVDQAEFATDLLFADRDSLKPLYEKLVHHAIEQFSAEDVMRFLGRKLHSGFAGEIVSHYKKRWPGARIKHRMKKNWIKMYDKHGLVLRIETVINCPYEFKIRRRGKRKGQLVVDWFPMAKGVANLYRYAEVSAAANRRYLDALAAVRDPQEPRYVIRELGQSVTMNDRGYRGFNPLNEDDVKLFAAALRGEHLLHGFRNAHVRERLFSQPSNRCQARSQCARVSRLLKRLHVRALIAKIPRTRRWRVTDKGHRFMSAIIELHAHEYPHLLAA